MKKRARNFTLGISIASISLLGLISFLNRQAFVESYWIYQLKSEPQRTIACQKLLDLQCHRAIPAIIDEFENMLMEDTDEQIIIEVSNFIPDPQFSNSRLSSRSKLHPMLYTVYSFGNGGYETLNRYIDQYMEKLRLKNKVKRHKLNSESVPTRKFSLYVSLQSILYLWEQGEGIEVVEGPG